MPAAAGAAIHSGAHGSTRAKQTGTGWHLMGCGGLFVGAPPQRRKVVRRVTRPGSLLGHPVDSRRLPEGGHFPLRQVHAEKMCAASFARSRGGEPSLASSARCSQGCCFDKWRAALVTRSALLSSLPMDGVEASGALWRSHQAETLSCGSCSGSFAQRWVPWAAETEASTPLVHR
jgi:hypothetical protein